MSGVVCFSTFGYCQYDYNPSTPEKPDPRAVAIKPTLLKLNQLVISEIEKGIYALQQKDISLALKSFITAIDIEPYEPMSYILLMKTLISVGQEDIAFNWLEKSGRNLSDSNQIISNLSTFLKDAPPVNDSYQTTHPIFLAPFKDNKRCAVSFIFDDGEPSISNDILPMFEKYGYRTTVAINPGVTPEDHDTIFRASWKSWIKAKKDGHEIANHGMNHKLLPGLSPQDLNLEVFESFKMIKDKLGEAPASFIFPQDEDTPELVKYVEQFHLVARDHETLHQIYPRICIPIYGGKRFSIPTIDRRMWLIPQCHGLYTPTIQKTFKAISKELLEDQIEYLHQNENSVWIARFIDVYKYLHEVKETQLDIKAVSANSAEFTIKNNLDKTIYHEPLTVVITPPLNGIPKSVKAYESSTKKEIPTRIVDQKILINTTPHEQTIHVEWN
jgi:peptidoglycan/xylan/chitin deacetylase (PgdA/CDA1 family)